MVLAATIRAIPIMGSRRRVEPLEPHHKTVPNWAIFDPSRQTDGSAVQPFQSFEHWAVILPEQSRRHVQVIVWVDTNQMRVEGSVMDFGERDAIGNDRLAKALVLVHDDVRCAQQQRLWQAR